jgi:tetratricopeptide (TPR) repeat protein
MNRYLVFGILLSGALLVGCKSTKNVATSEEGEPVGIVAKDNASLFIDANKEKVLGNYDEAIKLFNKCLEINPNDDASMFELARLHTLQGNSAAALEYAWKAASTDPNNLYYLLFYAGRLQAAKSFDEAAIVYEQVIELKPGFPEYYDKLAATYLKAGKPMEAIRVYDKLEEETGVSEHYSLIKQKIYVGENKIDEAIQELEKLIDAFPNEVKYHAILAEICMNNGMEERALEAYETISRLDPDDPYIHISLADYYKQAGDQEKAFEELKLGFENPSLDIDSKIQILIQYFTLNEIYEQLQEQALELAEILIRVHTEDPKAFSIYGDFLYQDEQYLQARDAFRQVIALDSSKYLVWEQLLFTNSELRDNNALFEESTRAIALFPEQPIPYLFAGGALYEKKEWNECIRVLEQGAYFVVGNDRLLAQFYAYLGDAYNQVDKTEKSDEAYDKVLMINPDHDYVLNNYAYYLSLRGENLEKAAKMAKRATELNPNTSSNQDTYGWVLYKMGYYEEAKIWIERAVENSEEPSAVILEHLGDVHWKLGDEKKAVELWEQAQAAGEGSEFLDQKVNEKKLIE